MAETAQIVVVTTQGVTAAAQLRGKIDDKPTYS